MSSTVLYDREIKLIAKNLQEAIDLSQFEIKFRTEQSDFETPNNVWIRLYNLSDETARRLMGEYTDLTLGAGYVENGGQHTIFTGSIKQVRRGRETPTDTYVDIIAAEGDLAYNFSVINDSLERDLTDPGTQIGGLVTGAGGNGVNSYFAPGIVVTSPRLSRGKVRYGLMRAYARDMARTLDATWSIQGVQGAPGEPIKYQLVFSKQTNFLYGADQAVVLTANTGLIGLPEQTENGIKVRCLLNPALRIGGAIKIDNTSIQTAQLNLQKAYLPGQPGVPTRLPAIASDGLYKILVLEHTGHTRGNPWYSEIVCLAINPSARVPVDPYWAGPGGPQGGGGPAAQGGGGAP